VFLICVYPRASAANSFQLDIQVPHIQRVVFDEFAARFDGVAHQHREDLISLDRVVDMRLSCSRNLTPLLIGNTFEI
jgi:hypothetical protein